MQDCASFVATPVNLESLKFSNVLGKEGFVIQSDWTGLPAHRNKKSVIPRVLLSGGRTLLVETRSWKYD